MLYTEGSLCAKRFEAGENVFVVTILCPYCASIRNLKMRLVDGGAG